MNLSRAQLRAQYEEARPLIGELVDAAERAFSLPPLVMWAIYSRETNLDPYYFTHPGDGGHGRGVGQVDDRSHIIPSNWASNLTWQVGTSAEIFASCLRASDGDVVRAANRYNSGQEKTEYTTGKDYGPDVYERWQVLSEMFVSTPREEFQIVQCILNMNGLCLDVSGQSKDNGAPIVQWSCNGQKNQGVSIEEVGVSGEDRVVRIKFDHSGKYLDCDPNRLEIVQWDRADVPGQLWVLEQAPSTDEFWQPVGTRIVSLANDEVLDVEGISNEPGAKLIHWPWNGQVNQQFLVARFR